VIRSATKDLFPIAFTLLALNAACRAGGPSGPRVQVMIPEGASVSAAAETLQTRGIIGSAGAFRFYARLLGKTDQIKAGVYEFTPDQPVLRALRILTTGREALRRLAVFEGLTLAEIAATVEDQLGVPQRDFLAAAQDTALAARVGSANRSLEGYLYPSTYLVRYGITAPEIVRMMVQQFEAQWRPEWNGRLAFLKMKRHQLVTLASIIEGEVVYGPDRPYVSSVYHNRLRRSMRLQADPTVIYVLGRRRRLFEKDYLRRSPYNTYLIDGLPPGPIGSPAAASIEAALYPAETDFLFFVAGPDGKHIFSRTHREHLAAITQVRRGKSEVGGEKGR
ncbi:MAG: endolytic transglycosylase MltG, partial [Gemmatimonadetes bacterium]|nr:endolytic transglycosylase MltG [Gemmatimonadota bacterium]